MRPDRTERCPQAEQSVGWALHALEPAEEAEAAAHVPRCVSCRELVGKTEELLAMLGSTETTFEPPAELRAGLLARIAETPQQPTLPLPTLVRAGVDRPARAPQPRPVPEPQPTPPAAEPPAEPPAATPVRARRWRLALVAAAVAVALGIGGLAIRTAQVEQQRDDQISQTQQLASRLSELQRPGGRTATLAPAGGTPIAAVVIADGERKVLTVGVPANSVATQTYVLWGTGTGAPRALGTFDVTEADTGLHRVGSVGEAEAFTGYAISLEPGRIEPASPSLMVASGLVQT